MDDHLLISMFKDLEKQNALIVYTLIQVLSELNSNHPSLKGIETTAWVIFEGWINFNNDIMARKSMSDIAQEATNGS